MLSFVYHYGKEKEMDGYHVTNNTHPSDDSLELFKRPVCECPVCKKAKRNGHIYENDTVFYCNNAVSDEPVCKFKLKKDDIASLVRRNITADEVISLCENGFFEAECTKIGDDSVHYTGIFKIKSFGRYFGLKLFFKD